MVIGSFTVECMVCKFTIVQVAIVEEVLSFALKHPITKLPDVAISFHIDKSAIPILHSKAKLPLPDLVFRILAPRFVDSYFSPVPVSLLCQLVILLSVVIFDELAFVYAHSYINFVEHNFILARNIPDSPHPFLVH